MSTTRTYHAPSEHDWFHTRECRLIRSGFCGLSSYCAPSVSVSDVIGVLAACRHNKPKTKTPLPPHPRAFAPHPFPSHHPPTFPPHPASLHLPSPSYLPPTVPSLLAFLHYLLLRIRESELGCCPIFLDMGLDCLYVCVFLFSLPRPLGRQCLRSGCLFYKRLLLVLRLTINKHSQI